MKVCLLVFFLFSVWNVVGQNIMVNRVINSVFCEPDPIFHHFEESIYIIAKESDSILSYSNFDTSCIDVNFCNNEKEFLKILKTEKELYLLTIKSLPVGVNERKFDLVLTRVNLKGNRRRLRVLIIDSSYSVTFIRKNNGSKTWEVLEKEYPSRMNINLKEEK